MAELGRLVRDIKNSQSAIADVQREIQQNQQNAQEKMDTLRQSIYKEVHKMMEQTGAKVSCAAGPPVVRQASAGERRVRRIPSGERLDTATFSARPPVVRQASAGARMVRRVPSGEQLHLGGA